MPPREDGSATYLWVCPICGKRRIGIYGAGDAYRAVNDLRTHIRSTKNESHGGPNAYPDGIDPHALEPQILRLDRRSTRDEGAGR